MNILASLERFRRDRRGVTAIMFAIMLPPFLISIGLAVDAGRAYLVHNRIAKALDASALAAARALNEDGAEEEAWRFFRANFGDSYLGATVPRDKFSFVPDEENDTVAVSADADMPTIIMGMFGKPKVSVADSAVVMRMNRGLELALVMDTTGSMGSGGKIRDMRDAATSLTNFLFGDEDEGDFLWVSVIPYIASVNVGPSHTDWLKPGDPAQPGEDGFAPTTWEGCVEARPNGVDQTDEPPDVKKLTSYFYAPDRYNQWIMPGTEYPEPEKRYDESGNEIEPEEPSEEELRRYREGYIPRNRGPNVGCALPIVPLTNKKQVVLDRIREMRPQSWGGTASNFGMVWGWRTISPRWRGLWGNPTPDNMPLQYNHPQMDKAVVLLTDGDNLLSSHYSSYADKSDLPSRAYRRIKEELDRRLAVICELMKNEGIRIYTITFGNGLDDATRGIYRGCASDTGSYFHAPTGEKLATVFRSIGQRLSNLRVMQ